MDQIKQTFQRNIFQRCNESLKSLRQNLDHSFLHIQVLQNDINNASTSAVQGENLRNKVELDNLQKSIKQIHLMLKSVKIGVDQIQKQCEETNKSNSSQNSSSLFLDPSKFLNTSNAVIKQQQQIEISEQFMFNPNSLNASRDDLGFDQNEEFFKHDKQDAIINNNNNNNSIHLPYDQQQNEPHNYPEIDSESESKKHIKLDDQYLFCNSKIKQESENGLKSDKKNFNKILKKANKIYKRGPYKHFSENEKNSAIECAKKSKDVGQTAKELGIPLKNLKRWIQVGSKRKTGGGRKTLDPNMESQLYKWIIQEYQQTQTKISRKVVREKALRMTNFPSKFKASKGWLEKFLNRYECKKLLNYENVDSEDLSVSNQNYPTLRMKQEDEYAIDDPQQMSNNYNEEDDEQTYVSELSQN